MIGFVTAQGWHGHHPSGVLAAASAATGGQLRNLLAVLVHAVSSLIRFIECGPTPS
jgi:hypothetical protein